MPIDPNSFFETRKVAFREQYLISHKKELTIESPKNTARKLADTKDEKLENAELTNVEPVTETTWHSPTSVIPK